MRQFRLCIDLEHVQTETQVAKLLIDLGNKMINDIDEKKYTFPNDEGSFPEDFIRDEAGHFVGNWEFVDL